LSEMPATGELAEAVLPLIRTSADLHRWSAANEHGRRMHRALDILEAAVDTGDPADVFAVTSKALASAVTIIARADDSSGVIGDVCRRLLRLHPVAAARANAPVAPLVKWMIAFQFHGKVDYFELDPVAYAPALGEAGMALYRTSLDDIANQLGPKPLDDQRWSAPDSHIRWVLEWNKRRLAVFDRDVEAIIRTHARDQKVAAWLHETARAFEEIDQISLAIEWAQRAADFDGGHQAERASDDWCRLLSEHRPSELIDAQVVVLRRWPTAAHAGTLYQSAGEAWDEYREEVMGLLSRRPSEAVTFALASLQDVRLAWELAHALGLSDDRQWATLAKSYEKVDPLAVLPVLNRLVRADLAQADAQHYRIAARRLKRMRQLSAGSTEEILVDGFIEELRENYRRRPRLQMEFDRVGLP
jgi:hypothetical protein